MKKIFMIILLSLVTHQNAHAFSMTCHTRCNPEYDWNCRSDETTDDAGFGMHIFVYGVETGIECITNKGETVYVQLAGVGPGMSIVWQDTLKVTCPTIRHEKLMNRLAHHDAFLFGPQISVFPFKLGLYGNARGNLCALAGFGKAAFGSATITNLRISKKPIL